MTPANADESGLKGISPVDPCDLEYKLERICLRGSQLLPHVRACKSV